MNKPKISRFFWYVAFGYLLYAYISSPFEWYDIPITLAIMVIAGILDLLKY